MTSRAVDFLSVEPRQSLAGWGLMAVGAASLVMALWTDERWATEQRAVERSELQASAIRRALQTKPPAAPPTLAERRWQQAQDEISHPWLAVLRAIESATADPVFLLSLVIDAGSGSIRLEGEAQTFDQVLAYVSSLEESGALERAVLVSHEQVGDPVTGHATVRFSATARWLAK